ncbi:D-aminoacid aminotransferase-like PLP-dependent enzyme [Penicillium alfredii]|uniref:D-aminoacid aminotransferase-like PLP-dependent enzyme n=1 Tax=Penicillium alfredii TaxID=1506179 RepID=A0A9W9F066_9EURO|nr:D-aminoacid aminotransferase-like PLP-dependent enzyme [Penicillium alfredii]KAJ5091105.1 D-aminoacid aminotransferase-like PLP-dependent enzyme [Penicillium alfredii]
MATMQQVFAGYHARQTVLESSNNPFAKGVAWVEGELVPLAKARIPLLDQGFMHSDLTYDVPSVWDGRCTKLRLNLPLPREKVKRILVDMVAKSGIRDAFVELIVTRGLKGVGRSKPEEIVNKLYMFIQSYVWVMEPEEQLVGGHAVIARTVHRIPPSAMDPRVKNLQWGDLVRGLFEAADRGASYPILTDGDGNLTEGSGFNIVLVKDGVLCTPDRGVLEGITRRSVIDVAQSDGLDTRVEGVPIDMAYHCDEVFMSTTAGGIMPITSLDGRPVNGGQIGPITKTIWDGYWAMHYDPGYGFEIDYEAQGGSV